MIAKKYAPDVRPGDVIVYGGVEHTVRVVLHEADCPHHETCPPEAACPGGVSIETDKSGEGNWIATFSHDEWFYVCPDDRFTACPPWCSQDPEWHDFGDPVHSTRFECITTGCLPGCPHHDEDPKSQRNADAWVSLDRADHDDKPGDVLVTVNIGVFSGETHFTLDQADKLVDAVLRLVTAARDNTPVIKADTTTDI